MLRRAFSFYREAYSGLPRNAWLLSLVQFVNRSGSMVLFFLTLYLTRKLGFTLAQAGQAISVFGVGALMGAWLGGILCDRLGATAVQRLSLLLGGLNLIAMGYMTSHAGDPGDGVPARGLRRGPAAGEHDGHGQGMPAGDPHPGLRPEPPGGQPGRDHRPGGGRLPGHVELPRPVLGRRPHQPGRPGHFRCFFQGRPWAARRTRPSPAAAAPPAAGKRHLPAIFIMVFGIGLIFSQLFSTFPLYMHSAFGFAENRIGQLLAINTVIIVIFEMVLLHGLKNAAPLKVIAVGTLLTGVGFALTPLGRGFLWAAFTVAVWTVGEMLSLPLLTTEIANRSHEGNRGRHMGWYGVSFSLAWMLGPLAGAAVYERISPLALWLGCGGLGVLLALGFRWLAAAGDGRPPSAQR